jgi:hypothetical protein
VSATQFPANPIPAFPVISIAGQTLQDISRTTNYMHLHVTVKAAAIKLT